MNKGIKERKKLSETISFLHQLILTLEEAEIKLEEAYKKENPLHFNNMKEFILKVQNKISEEVSSSEIKKS